MAHSRTSRTTRNQSRNTPAQPTTRGNPFQDTLGPSQATEPLTFDETPAPHELREFQVQNPGFTFTANPGPSRQPPTFPATGTIEGASTAPGGGAPLLLIPDLSEDQRHRLQAQRETYFDMQMQLLQAQIDKSAAQVAQLKAEALRTNQDLEHDPLAEDLGKNDSPIVSSIAAAHPGIDRQYIRQIESNSFHPAKLFLLQAQRGAEGIQDDTFRVDTNGNLRAGPDRPTRAKFGQNSDIWVTGFNNYVSIIHMLHGLKFPGLVPAMLAFLNQIRRLNNIYKWQTGALELALEYHCHVISNGVTDSTLWLVVPTQWVDIYCNPATVRPLLKAAPTSRKREFTDQDSLRDTLADEICDKWNDGRCTYRNGRCYRKHECRKCGSKDHPEWKCKT